VCVGVGGGVGGVVCVFVCIYRQIYIDNDISTMCKFSKILSIETLYRTLLFFYENFIFF